MCDKFVIAEISFANSSLNLLSVSFSAKDTIEFSSREIPFLKSFLFSYIALSARSKTSCRRISELRS